MASYLQIENISKSYGPKVLFEKIGFNINEGDKIALIAPNGTGKTSLMRILAGKDKSDSGGKIMFLKDIKIAFLEQEYPFDPEKSIFDQIMSSSEEFTKGLDQEHVWEYERRVVKFLTNFNLNDPDQKMKELSGGEVKRVALTQMLATEAEFFIMDEPTNHLDIDAIEFLEGYLSRSRCTLLMVTHDRYFLDRVCNIVMEMDHGAVYTYKGNYQNYLEKREERIANYNAETDKVRNILRRELEWMRRGAQARTTKAKARIEQAIDALIAHGWQVGVITWAPKGVAEEEPFFIETKRAKQEWLRRHYPELLENFYCLPYGESKSVCACDHWKKRSLDPDMGVQILVDDNMLVRDEWVDGWETHFKAIDANSDYVKTLEGLVM